ncbi:hypothetical protein [Streptomyces sp. PR69]|uniref:hypothetical protein n=1 Tax=Streptomyces sp. PR69 TaxID=2984950 RepID=UPI0022653F75|nr:hypothetical protein [Streptomyces sp. PR69]
MRRRTYALTAVCALLLTAGCGGEDADGGAERAGAAVEASAKPSAQSAAPSPAPEHTATVRAAIDAVGRTSARVSQKTELGDGTTSHTITADGDFDFAGDRGNLTVALPPVARFEEVFADGKVYLRGTAGAEQMGWQMTDRNQLEARRLLRAPANDPAFVLRQAVMTRTEFARVGEEKLNGVPTVHYLGFLSDEAITLRMTADAREKAEQLRTAFGGRIPVVSHVWVDSQGRAVQVQLALRVKDLIDSVTTLTFTEFGKRVQVTVPPAEDVVPVPSLDGPLGV